MRKFLALMTVLVLLLSLAAPAMASGEASGETAAAEDTGPKAAIVLTDEGEDPTQEQTENLALTYFPGGEKTDAGVTGFLFTSPASATAFLFSELKEDAGTWYTVGGEGQNVAADEYPVTAEAADYLGGLGVTAFDSAIVLADSEAADSCPPVLSAKGYTYLDIEGVLILADGAARSAFYADISGGTTVPGSGAGGTQGDETPVVIVRRSLLETTGGTAGGDEETFSVLSTGSRARGIQPQGKSITYLYDSAIVSRTWGAWSTDSARSNLDLVAYRSLGLSQGGYGAYADTSCHLYLYGSEVRGASDGIVASNNGEIYAVASDSAETSGTLRSLMGKDPGSRDLSWTDYADGSAASGESARQSVIMGGQAAVQFHMPDMGHSGAANGQKATLYMDGGTLATSADLLGADGVQSLDSLDVYNQRYAGACIVTKSTQVNALLKGVTMESWSGELIHTMINSDSNVNDIADGDEAQGSDITFENMDVTGDIVNDDYQRTLRLYLNGTTLTGAVYSNTCEDWNALCQEEFDGQYILNPDGYESVWGVVVTLSDGAVWNVTDTSVVQDLIINDGCTVNGVISENPDGTLTVSPLTSPEASGEAS